MDRGLVILCKWNLFGAPTGLIHFCGGFSQDVILGYFRSSLRDEFRLAGVLKSQVLCALYGTAKSRALSKPLYAHWGTAPGNGPDNSPDSLDIQSTSALA